MKFDHLISHFGSVSALSKASGIPPTTIWSWKYKGVIPDDRQLELAKLSNRVLKADPAIVKKYTSFLVA